MVSHCLQPVQVKTLYELSSSTIRANQSDWAVVQDIAIARGAFAEAKIVEVMSHAMWNDDCRVCCVVMFVS